MDSSSVGSALYIVLHTVMRIQYFILLFLPATVAELLAVLSYASGPTRVQRHSTNPAPDPALLRPAARASVRVLHSISITNLPADRLIRASHTARQNKHHHATHPPCRSGHLPLSLSEPPSGRDRRPRRRYADPARVWLAGSLAVRSRERETDDTPGARTVPTLPRSFVRSFVDGTTGHCNCN